MKIKCYIFSLLLLISLFSCVPPYPNDKKKEIGFIGTYLNLFGQTNTVSQTGTNSGTSTKTTGSTDSSCNTTATTTTTTPSATTWLSNNTIGASVWISVVYGNGRFVAVGQTGTNRVMISSD